ncbi:MAG: hypothetical protein Q4F43_02660 [Eubacteriales bacterium]|nr:hypothetical protein [Eubacteriales bacterium]
MQREGSLFEKMLAPDRREQFLAYRGNRKIEDFRIKRMENYLNSRAYETDVRRLMAGDYYLSIPEKKMIPKGYTDRKRTVYHFEENEMTLLRIMSFCLHDYEALFPKEVYSFKKGISAKNFIFKICADQRFQEMYVAKTDIIGYGNSIDADILISFLEKYLGEREEEAVAFFRWLLSRQTFRLNGTAMKGNTAALPGIPIHNFFTNLYLAETDRFLIPRCEAYARYSDDIIMYSLTKKEAEGNLSVLLARMKSLHLSPHTDESKTKVFGPGESYDYLGISFSGGNIDIAGSSLKKLKRKMRIRAKRIGLDKKRRFATAEEKARHLIRLNHATFYGTPGSSDLSWSQWAFPVITKTDGLHELDLYNQHCIRYVLTGKWSDSQFRISYQKLKELGYDSLVRAYYAQKNKGRSTEHATGRSVGRLTEPSTEHATGRSTGRSTEWPEERSTRGSS